MADSELHTTKDPPPLPTTASWMDLSWGVSACVAYDGSDVGGSNIRHKHAEGLRIAKKVRRACPLCRACSNPASKAAPWFKETNQAAAERHIPGSFPYCNQSDSLSVVTLFSDSQDQPTFATTPSTHTVSPCVLRPSHLFSPLLHTGSINHHTH